MYAEGDITSRTLLAHFFLPLSWFSGVFAHMALPEKFMLLLFISWGGLIGKTIIYFYTPPWDHYHIEETYTEANILYKLSEPKKLHQMSYYICKHLIVQKTSLIWQMPWFHVWDKMPNVMHVCYAYWLSFSAVINLLNVDWNAVVPVRNSAHSHQRAGY